MTEVGSSRSPTLGAQRQGGQEAICQIHAMGTNLDLDLDLDLDLALDQSSRAMQSNLFLLSSIVRHDRSRSKSKSKSKSRSKPVPIHRSDRLLLDPLAPLPLESVTGTG